MIQAVFYQKQKKACGYRISGHAGYAESGEDVVCAAVSSAVQLATNLLTEVFHVQASVKVEEACITCHTQESVESGEGILSMLAVHIQGIAQEFPNTIQVTFLEV